MVDKLNETPEYDAAISQEINFFDLLRSPIDSDLKSTTLKISSTQNLKLISGQDIENRGTTIRFSLDEQSIDYEWSISINPGLTSEPRISSMNFYNPNGPSWEYTDGSTIVNLKYKPGMWDLDLREIKTLGGKLTVFDEMENKVEGESADAIIEINNRNIVVCSYVLQRVVKNPSLLTTSTHALVKNPNLI